MSFDRDGYILLKNIFTNEQIQQYKKCVLDYCKTHSTIKNAGGITIPDFMRHKDLEMVGDMKENAKIQKTLQELLGNNYRFCGHNDIGVNRVVGWHKDKLNGIYAKCEKHNIWSPGPNGDKFNIVKVLVYLQDHSNNNDGLKLVPCSHKTSSMDTKGWIQMRPTVGDVLIFDQRITHRGMDRQVKEPRILVAFGYGVNNVFTDEFERGTIQRQNDQNKKV